MLGPGRFEALLSHQGPLVHADHSHRAPAPTGDDCRWWDSACKEHQAEEKRKAQERAELEQGLELMEKTYTIDMETDIMANGEKVMNSGDIGVGQWFIQVTVESIGTFLTMQRHVITFLYDKPPGARQTSLRIYDGNQVWLDVDVSKKVTLEFAVRRQLKRWETQVLAKAMYAYNQVVKDRGPNTLTSIGR